MRLSAKFLLEFFALAAVLFALWSFAGMGDAYGRLMATVAGPFVEAFTDCEMSVGQGPKGLAIRLSRTDPQGKVYQRTMPLLPREVFSGLIPFLALMLATGGMSWRAKGRATALGLAILFAFHFGLMMIGPYLTGLPQAHLDPQTIRGVVQPVVNVIYGFSGLIGYAALPFLLWFWLGARTSGMAGAPPARQSTGSRAERRRKGK